MSDLVVERESFSLKLPTYERYRYLKKKICALSLTRALQYEVLESYNMQGRVLDFGGGEKASYRSKIKCSSYDSINIDSNIEPTWIVNVGDVLPRTLSAYDTVLSLNTLEHVFDAEFTINELSRILKPGGELLLSVPFLYPIHGHPDDFFRPTPSWFRFACKKAGFSKVEVIPLSWGPFTTGIICSGLPGPFKKIRKYTALLLDLLYFKLREKRHSSITLNEQMVKYASAFFVRAIK